MSKNNAFYPVKVSLCLMVVFVLPLSSVVLYGDDLIDTTDEFIARVEQEYSDIKNLRANSRLSGVDPPLELNLWAITDTRILRLEYISPPQMKGQFFLLKQDILYQYMPARDMIIKKDLTQENLPVKAANLTPDYLLEMINSEELEVELVGRPINLKLHGPINVDLAPPEGSGDYCPVKPETFGDPGLEPSMVTSRVLTEKYVLKIVPRVEKYQFSRQIIVFDPDSYLPEELITYLPDKPDRPVKTKVLDSQINCSFDPDQIERLPPGADIISG